MKNVAWDELLKGASAPDIDRIVLYLHDAPDLAPRHKEEIFCLCENTGVSVRRLSELEHCVLGLLYCDGALSGYRVRQAFATSPSSVWSGSAGAIYPLLKRLEERGLISGARGRTGARASVLYRLTGEGRTELRRWLTEQHEPGDVIETDPVRTRIRFFSALSPRARREAVGDMIEQLGAAVAQGEEALAAMTNDTPQRLCTEFAVTTQRSRLSWLIANRHRIEALRPSERRLNRGDQGDTP